MYEQLDVKLLPFNLEALCFALPLVGEIFTSCTHVNKNLVVAEQKPLILHID